MHATTRNKTYVVDDLDRDGAARCALHTRVDGAVRPRADRTANCIPLREVLRRQGRLDVP